MPWTVGDFLVKLLLACAFKEDDINKLFLLCPKESVKKTINDMSAKRLSPGIAKNREEYNQTFHPELDVFDTDLEIATINLEDLKESTKQKFIDSRYGRVSNWKAAYICFFVEEILKEEMDDASRKRINELLQRTKKSMPIRSKLSLAVHPAVNLAQKFQNKVSNQYFTGLMHLVYSFMLDHVANGNLSTRFDSVGIWLCIPLGIVFFFLCTGHWFWRGLIVPNLSTLISFFFLQNTGMSLPPMVTKGIDTFITLVATYYQGDEKKRLLSVVAKGIQLLKTTKEFHDCQAVNMTKPVIRFTVAETATFMKTPTFPGKRVFYFPLTDSRCVGEINGNQFMVAAPRWITKDEFMSCDAQVYKEKINDFVVYGMPDIKKDVPVYTELKCMSTTKAYYQNAFEFMSGISGYPELEKMYKKVHADYFDIS